MIHIIDRPVAEHAPACVCGACLVAEDDAARVRLGLQPQGFRPDRYIRIPAEVEHYVLSGEPAPMVFLPGEFEDARPVELVDAGAIDPVMVHVEDVFPGMYARVEGFNEAGGWATVTGFLTDPVDADGLLAVGVAAEPGGSAVTLLVDPDSLVELREAPAGLAARAALTPDVGQVHRLEMWWEHPDGKPVRHEAHQVDSLAEVDAHVRRHDPDGYYVAATELHAYNWRGQR